MQKKPRAPSLLLAGALAIAAVPLAGAAPLAVDADAPIVSAVAGAPNPAELGDSITVTPTVDDSATGGSNIQSAEFNVNGGVFAALAAADGIFDSPTENVTGSFNIEALGPHQICVRGTDAAGNASTEACATHQC